MSNTSEDFSPGDVVCLNSARYTPNTKTMMVVGLIVDPQMARDFGLVMGIHCDWHDLQLHPRNAVYHPCQLQIIKKASP